ncbi:hypothetical protein BH11PSE11_BH11PSE11_01080 [soil metagenome]
MYKQRGELSLVWCAILMGALAFTAMAALFAMRYQRNLFAEAWVKMIRDPVVQSLQESRAVIAETASKTESTVMRKCTVNGKIVYSNVDCGADNPTSVSVKLNDSRGIEAPKVPVVVASGEEIPNDLDARLNLQTRSSEIKALPKLK